MKHICLLLALLVSGFAYAQPPENREIEAQLFLPSHVLKGLTADQKLVVHYVAQNAAGEWETSKVAAKKGKDNLYNFSLKPAMYFRLIFVIADYSYSMMCIDNRKGTAAFKYNFNVLLEKRKFDPQELNLIAPCPVRDDDDEEEEE